MDIQVMTSGWLAEYICKYATKPEPTREVIVNRNSIGQYLNARDYSIAEIVFYLAGYHVVQGSRKVITAPAGRGLEENRALKPASILATMADDDEDIEYANKQDLYMNRPQQLENASYQECLARFEMKRDEWKSRSAKALVRAIPFLRPTDGEDYYEQQLTLQKPFRSREDLKEENQTWREAYIEFGLDPPQLFDDEEMPTMEILREHHPIQEGAVREELRILANLMANVRTIRASPNMVHRLNPDQYDVYEEIRRQTGQVLVCIVGSAGTGKSYLLGAVRALYGDKAVVVAPTGVAAMNVNGSTIHSRFRLWNKGNGEFETLLFHAVGNEARNMLMETTVLIIEEVFMVSAELLRSVSTIFQKLRDDRRPFGGIDVVLVGDVFQLPPVEGRFCWESLLWRAFNVRFLTINMRQQADIDYATFLNRLRVGSPIDEIDSYMKTLNTEEDDDSDAIRLTALKETVQRGNRAKLNMLQAPEVVYSAIDSNERYRDRLQHGTRLESQLILKVGARVMLLWNLDLEEGLVNGTIGVVVHTRENAVLIAYWHDGQQKQAYIKQVKGSMDIAEMTIHRIQIPLTLAWYITVHKSQSLTLPKVVILEVEQMFAYGQLYVAMSRVRSSRDIKVFRYRGLPYSTRERKIILADDRVLARWRWQATHLF